MKNNPLITVIVPIYKAEKYIGRCIDSLLKQTYKNIEIILVDDGSPDNCPKICDDYSLKNSRIKVIHKENGGVSSARNAGIDLASGDFICFVDSDDWMSENGIEILIENAEKVGCEFVIGVCVTDKGKTKNIIDSKRIISFFENPEELISYICKPGSYSPYAKIYRTDIIKKFDIKYNTDLKCSEDALMIRQYLRYCKSICLIPDVVYYYNTENENSLSKKRYEDYCFYYIEKLKALKDLVEILPLSEEQKNQFLLQRAVHGLKISINHYLINWSDEKRQIELVSKAIDTFYPWLFIAELDNVFYLYKWWKKNIKNVKEKNVEKMLQREKKNRLWLKLKKFLKNNI